MKGKLIKERRKELGLTLEELGKSIGVKKSTIQKYEIGIIENIPIEKIKKLAEVLIISPQELLGLEEDNSDISIISLLQEIKAELQDINRVLKKKERKEL